MSGPGAGPAGGEPWRVRLRADPGDGGTLTGELYPPPPPAPGPARPRFRTYVLWLVLAFGSLVALAAMIKVRRVWVHAELRTTAVSLTLAEDADAVDGLPLAWIVASQLSAVTLTDSTGSPRDVRPAPGQLLSFADSAGAGGGTVLSSLYVPAGDALGLRTARPAGSFVLSLGCDTGCAARTVRLALHGPHRVRVGGGPAGSAPAPPGGGTRYARLHLSRGVVALHLVPASLRSGGLTDHLAVRAIRFDERAIRSEGVRVTPWSASGILGGTLHFPTLGSRVHPLRVRQWLRVDVDRGWVETIQLEGDSILVSFTGRVRGLSTGPEDEPVNLKPSVLEWLHARFGLKLFLTTVLVGFPIGYRVLSWFTERK